MTQPATRKPLRIVIFAKAPIPGFAKTRLSPVLGDEGAAALAAQLLIRMVTEAIAANIGTVELCVTPDPNLPQWETLNLPADIFWEQQGEGDLGERMSRAAQRVIDQHQSVLIIGTDCPMLDANMLQLAAEKISQSDICLGPVGDGGYVLLGMNRFDPSLFADIPWSTEQVAELTRDRISALKWRLQELPLLYDIDEPEDLKWLPEDDAFAEFKTRIPRSSLPRDYLSRN
jgi:rSAM/selenodomain-associated transferase 1